MVVLPDDAVGEVRGRVPIEELIRDYNVSLLPSGGKRLRALCPFHHEKTPSFHVNIEKQFYHCFGCNAHGDIFTFVEKMDHVDFREALEILARKAGVPLGPRGGGGPARGEKMGLFDALALAEEVYHRILVEDPRGAPARSYLEGRRIGPEMWKRFRLGYSPLEWDSLLRQAARKGIQAETLERAGLARRREDSSGGASRGGFRDYFRGRVMFPIADPQKRVIGFGARALDDTPPKYLNTPRTALFDKGQVLYGLPLARAAIEREGRIAVMEGYTDAIMAHQEGLEHAVASLGTAFTAENARRLRRLATRVDLIFDGDAAGQTATERSLDLLVGEDLDVRIFTVRTGKDPCDALLQLGGEEFRRRVEAEAVEIFEFKWKRTVAAAEARGEGPSGVARALDEMLALLSKVPNPVARKLRAKSLAERLGVEEGDLVVRALQAAPRAPRGGVGVVPSPRGDGGGASGVQGGVEEVLLECLLGEPERAGERLLELRGVGGEGLAGIFPAGSGLRPVAEGIERSLASGGLDTGVLLGDLDEEGSREALVSILARIDREPPGARIGRDEVWKNCLRELERKALERRRSALGEAKALARRAGDETGYRALAREELDVLRRLKSPHRDARRPDALEDGVPRGGSEKGNSW